jgi:uncharacterized membrane-anchored protein YitT (DUF2179 family)
MLSFWNRVVMQSIAGRTAMPSRYQYAKKIRLTRLSIKRTIRDAVLLMIAVASAGFGLKGFLLPNGFIDGGAVGISLLLAETTTLQLSALLIIVNLPFVLMGLRIIGLEFAIKTALAILTLAAAVAFIPYPQITQDKLLVAVFGGFFLGAGIGLAVRGGGVLDGTEVLAIAISRKTGATIGDIILIINILIFSFAAWLLSLEVALYSILTYLSASKTVDFIIEGLEEYTGVTIISPKAEQIQDMIITVLRRGVTIYKGERGYGKKGHSTHDMRIVFTVVTRLEVAKLNAEIEKIDPNAFVVMNSIKDTKGGMIKKRPLKK